MVFAFKASYVTYINHTLRRLVLTLNVTRKGYLYFSHKIIIFSVLLMLVLVLKDSLRTFFKSVSWSFGSGFCPCGAGPCPCPGPCGLVLVLVFSPCKDLFSLFRFIRIILYCSINPIQLV